MARGVNKAMLIGNLGADPETRHTTAGTAVTKFRIATSESWRDRQSEQQQEHTEWHRVVAFGRLAEICQEYLRKGSKVYIEGPLRTSSWEDQEGVKRWSTEIQARDMQMLDSRGSSGERMDDFGPMPDYEIGGGPGAAGGGTESWGGSASSQTEDRGQKATKPDTQKSSEAEDDLDDDIPF